MLCSLLRLSCRKNVSSESSARQRIHSKYQALFSSKDKSKILKCRLLQFLLDALRVKKMWISQTCFTCSFAENEHALC